MTDPDTPPTENIESEQPKPARLSPYKGVFTQPNITTGLALAAVILAGAPYVVPQIGAWQVRNGLMSRPAMLQDAFDRLQAERTENTAAHAALAIRAHRDSIFNDKDDPVIGKGPIKVVEFLDYQCAYCRAGAPAIQQFLAANPDVQLIVKEYPVVHPPASRTLAAYGYAAWRSGTYEPVHYAFLTQTIHTQGELDTILTKNGIDPAMAKTEALSQAMSERINRTITLGMDLGINGTPAFIVGDKLINGSDIPALSAAVAAQRKHG